MKTSSIIILIVIIVLIAGGIWFWVNSQNQYATGPATYAPQGTTYASTSTATTNTTTTAATGPAILDLATSAKLGSYLTAANGMTLYHYTQDTPGVSNCTGQCAALWHPYTVSATTALVGATGVNSAIGTITRSDGSLQVTYNGEPLYFWYRDAKPGDMNGQNVGGVWFVVSP